ncbi:hypothetical protein LCGC14_2178450 [marine sediment metagenome]|uniref:Uncharacterized protein n=1 Tax=marine sediment metagenome TaxID=412755 RepID=A0A0F9G0I9_9ZZZZ
MSLRPHQLPDGRCSRCMHFDQGAWRDHVCVQTWDDGEAYGRLQAEGAGGDKVTIRSEVDTLEGIREFLAIPGLVRIPLQLDYAQVAQLMSLVDKGKPRDAG